MTNMTPYLQPRPSFEEVNGLLLADGKTAPPASTEGVDADDAQIPEDQDGDLTDADDDEQADDDDDIVGPDGNRG
jgi:hypothetical protein